MNLNKMAKVSIILVLVTACKVSINGEIEVRDDLLFNPKKSSKPQIQVMSGQYPAVLTFKSKKKMYLTIKNNSETPILFKIPKGKNIPETSGFFSLSNNDSKQPYDLEANVDTNYSQSDLIRRSESCSETSFHNVCHYDHDGRRVCYMDSYEVYGVRTVEGYTKYTTKTIDAELLDSQTRAVVAQFSGKDIKAKFIRSYYGPCFVRGYGGLGHF